MQAKNDYFLITLGMFSVLLVLGICFAHERIVFMDNAFQLFLMVNDKSIEVMAGRYPAVIARLLPLFGIKAGLGLNAIIYLFSISYILVQFIFVLASHLLLKDKRWVVATVLSFALVMGNTFFWCNSELSQALPFSILVLGLSIEYYRSNRFIYAIITVIIASSILVFYHPQSLMVYLFGLFFFLPLRWEKRKGYLLPLLVLIVFICKSIWVKNWYDTLKFEGLANNLKQLYPNYLRTDSFNDFFLWLPTELLLLTTVFVLTLVVLIWKKKWFQFILLMVASVLSVSVFHITNVGAMTVYYAEAGYLVWSGLVAIAFTFEVLDQFKFRKLIYTILLICCLAKVLVVSKFYVDRQDEIATLVQKYRGEKAIINREVLPKKWFQLDWALPFETIIHSTLANRNNPTTIVPSDNEAEHKDFMDGLRFISGMGSVLDIQIDSNYFDWNGAPYKLYPF